MNPAQRGVSAGRGLAGGLLSGLAFGSMLLVLEGTFHLALGITPWEGHASMAGYLASYLLPFGLVGLCCGGVLGGRGVRGRVIERVLYGLLAAFVFSIVLMEVLDRTGLRRGAAVRAALPLAYSGVVLGGLLAWCWWGRGRVPPVERWRPWGSAGLFLALFSSVTIGYQANTQLFADPFALSSLAGSGAILAACFAAFLPLSYLVHRLRSLPRRLALSASLAGAGGVVILFIGLTVPGTGGGDERPAGPPRGTVLIVADTLRADAIGAYAGPQGASQTPSIDRLAAEGVLFETCTASSNWTLPSFASLLTSRYPSAHGAGINAGDGTLFTPLRAGVPTLPGLLRRGGVRTAALVNNTYLHRSFGLDHGFDEYRMLRGAPDHQILFRMRTDLLAGSYLPYAPANLVASAFRGALDRLAGGRFFLMVQLMDVHAPYHDHERGGIYSDRGEGLESPEGLAAARRAYLSELRFLDRFVGEMHRELDRRGLLDSTLVIFAADHGEAFAEHGETGHGRVFYEEAVRVPLIVAGAGVARPGRRVDAPVGLVDLLPTILGWWGIEPPGEIVGESLLSVLRDRGPGEAGGGRRAILGEAAYGREKKMLRIGSFKLIQNLGDSPDSIEMYDLARDPGERHDLAGEHPERARRLLRRMLREASRIAPVEGTSLPRDAGPAKLDPAARARLRALGYLEGGGR